MTCPGPSRISSRSPASSLVRFPRLPPSADRVEESGATGDGLRRPHVDRAGLALREGRGGRAEGTGQGAASQVAASRSPALPCAAVAASVFVVYASFGTGAEPQVLGVASSAPRAVALAERYADEERYVWRGSDWLEWDSARRVRPAVDGRGHAGRGVAGAGRPR